MPDTLKQLLLKYQKVFLEPIGLSHSRACNHRIHLQTSTAPVKVKPYRYPHSQKMHLKYGSSDVAGRFDRAK